MIFTLLMFYKFRKRLRKLKNLYIFESNDTFKKMKRGKWDEATKAFQKQYSTKRALERFLRLKK